MKNKKLTVCPEEPNERQCNSILAGVLNNLIVWEEEFLNRGKVGLPYMPGGTPSISAINYMMQLSNVKTCSQCHEEKGFYSSHGKPRVDYKGRTLTLEEFIKECEKRTESSYSVIADVVKINT